MARTARKAFLKYIGRRKWRKIKGTNNTTEKNFLKYLGNRKWKKAKD